MDARVVVSRGGVPIHNVYEFARSSWALPAATHKGSYMMI